MLPQPTDAFDWVQAAGGPALVCRPLASLAPHLFTTRGWALGSRTGEDGGGAWDQVAAAMQVDRSHLVRVHQVHGTTVVVRRANQTAAPAVPAARPDADIIVSNDCSFALAIQTADCVPLLISYSADRADAASGAVLAAHAGWRGLAARVPTVAVDALVREFGARPVDLVAAIGPSIGACCYEVGDDVRGRFESAGFLAEQLARWFAVEPRSSSRNRSMPSLSPQRRANHWFFDGWAAAREQLLEAGVPAQRIYSADLCTASHPEVFCSYRRDGAPAGRMAAVVRARRVTPPPPVFLSVWL
jgi:polyphenol oxidase